MTHTDFQFFFENSLAVVVKTVDLTSRAVMDSFEIYTIKFFTINKNLGLILLCIKLHL